MKLKVLYSLSGLGCSCAALGLCSSFFQVISCAHDGVFHRVLFADTCWHGLEFLVLVESKEEGARVPFGTGLVDHAVHGRDKVVVGLSHQAIGNVDHHGAGDGLSVDPIAGFGQDLQAAIVILCEECEAFEVGVGSDSELI